MLYDVSSTYFEGRTCELAKFGHNRDGKSGKLQIVFGLLCTKDGCPVAVEVFEGNIADPARSPVRSINSSSALRWTMSFWSVIAA